MSRRRAMLSTFLIVLFCMRLIASDVVPAMGSILFDDRGFAKKCFVQEDFALLATRMKFQELLPGERRTLMSDDEVAAIMRYFYGVNEIIERESQEEVRMMVQKSFYDLLGSYIKNQLLPITKFSFYTGNVTFSNAQNVMNLFERCKELLNTNGNGWSEPITDFSQFFIAIEPLVVSTDMESKACVNLAMNQNDDENNEEMLVPLPKMESGADEDMSTIWLPLKRKHIFNINSQSSAFILLRYYVMVSQCYNFQGMNQAIFNRKLKTWVVEYILPYLEDEKLYPAFGGVLRLLETIKEPDDVGYVGSKNKAMSLRKHLLGMHNDFDDGDESVFDIDDDGWWWWFKVCLFGGGGTIVAFLAIFVLCYLCQRSKIFDRILRILRRRHHPDDEEFHSYKRHSPKVKFEDEKTKKHKKGNKAGARDQVDLPLLGNESDSADDIVLHDSSIKKQSSKYKISESSDEGSSAKKSPSKAPGFMRFKSYHRKEKSRSNTSGRDTLDER